MKNLFRQLLNNGIHEGLTFSEKNKLRVFNPAVFFVLVISLFYVAVGFFVHLRLALLVSVVSCLCCLVSMWLVGLRRYQAAYHFMICFAFIYLTAFCLLFGTAPQSYLYFLFMPVASNILFDNIKVSIKYFVAILIFIAFTMVYTQSHPPFYAETPMNSYFFGVSNALFTATLVFLGVRAFKTENVNYSVELETKNAIIEEKNKNITDSINYARRIQYTLLAHENFLKQYLPEHFVLFRPKDIVSGDFYWATVNSENTGTSGHAQLPTLNPELRTHFYLAVCDSTGHGVPGAFMSLLNSSFLNEAINEKGIREPHLILNHVRRRLIESISQEGGKDGMDAILVSWELGELRAEQAAASANEPARMIRYAAANNHPVIIRGGEIIELPKDKMPVGKGERDDSFALHSIEVLPGDMLYLYTDGFADQFGGPKGKKFKYKQLNELLLSIAGQPLVTQRQKLDEAFQTWKGKLEQVDDVCVVGIRV